MNEKLEDLPISGNETILRRSEIDDVTFRQPANGSKFRTNLSGAKSGKGQIIYAIGQRATHVLLLGMKIPWAEKAPYVPSGESIWGGLEYDEATDSLKCHECAEWQAELGCHLRVHKINAREYRSKHYLKARTSLCSFRLRAVKAGIFARLTKQNQKWSSCNLEAANKVLSTRPRGMKHQGPSAEHANVYKRCKAQFAQQLLEVKRILGRTPTHDDLLSLNPPIYCNALEFAFGMKYRDIILSLGIKPNPRGVIMPNSERSLRNNAALCESRRQRAKAMWQPGGKLYDRAHGRTHMG